MILLSKHEETNNLSFTFKNNLYYAIPNTIEIPFLKFGHCQSNHIKIYIQCIQKQNLCQYVDSLNMATGNYTC